MPLSPTTAPHPQARPLTPVVVWIMGAFALIALIALIALVVGCTPKPSEKEAVGAAGPEFQACRARCELHKTQCQQRQETRERGCAERYTSDLADYDLCVKSGAKTCRAPYTCLGADLGICQQEYEPCLTICNRRGERRPDLAVAVPADAATEETAPAPAADKAPAAPAKVDKAPTPTPKAGKSPGPAPKPAPKVEKTSGAAG